MTVYSGFAAGPEAEAAYRALLESAPDAIVAVDVDGVIVVTNAQAERLFGYRRDELLGRTVDMLVPEAARAEHAMSRRGYAADPRPRPMGAGRELAGRRRDGSEFPAEISLSSICIDDRIVVSAAIRDITDRVEAQAERERLKAKADRAELEHQLHQSQRLESLGQLAGGVAHDFNNLLAVILNYSAFVAEEVAAVITGPDAARWQAVQNDVEQIQRAAERATSLTRQLLAFGRREVVQPRVLSLNDVVVDLEQLLCRSLGEHVELVTNLAPDLWPVRIDPGQVEQVLVNLAVNARDAMTTGGHLTIDTSNLVVDDEYASTQPNVSEGPYVRMRVSDSGTGMEPAVIDRAFEPFFTTKPKGEGAGLGLATVYGVVAQAGGSAKIYSEAGVGTTVSVLLPATEDVSNETVGRGAVGQRLDGSETVLLVEDEDAMREVTRRILVRHGYRVLTAGGGPEAVALATVQGPTVDLLLTDVVMPRMLGKEVAERVTAICPHVRVLFMSGYARPVLASQSTLDAGVRLVEKPFSAMVLLGKVREVLDAGV